MKHKKEKQVSSYELLEYSKSLQPQIEKIVSGLGVRLLRLSFVNENQITYLRLTITHPERNISLDDCEFVSKETEKELDNNNLIPFSYTLEVQSSGIDEVPRKESKYQFELKDFSFRYAHSK